MLKVLDLFSGIGGFSLGLERTGGFKTVAFCEIEPYCRRVLAKHWPEVPIFEDIRTLSVHRLAPAGIAVDVICGGFPCQDISVAGAGAGLAGERSGLWREFARLIGEIRPSFVIVENVSALLGRGLGEVLGDLAALWYDAEWHCIPASAIGAEHERDRIWIIAYLGGSRLPWWEQTRTNRGYAGTIEPWLRPSINAAQALSRDYWDHQPVLGRGIHGVPHRVDRVRALGNSVVPQIPEMIGRSIMNIEDYRPYEEEYWRDRV